MKGRGGVKRRGRGQQALHGASDSVLSQAAHTAATERRLKGLADDQVSCSSNAAPCSSSQVDSVASSDALPESGAASSFKSSSPIKAPHMESNTPQHPQKIDSALLQKGKEEGGALLVPGSSNEYQLHAAPATPSKLLNRISGPVTPPDDSETSKMHPHDATPTASDSDRSQDSILQLADRPTWASAISTSVSAPGYPNQLTATPFDSIFHPRHALIPSRSSHSLASVADSMFTEGSVKLEAIAPAPSNHTPIRTISITLSSITLDTLAHSVDGDAASFTSAYWTASTTIQDAVSVKSVHSQHTRRHTAIVLLSNSEDENEDENNEMESDGAGEEAAASSSSDPSVTSSMMSSRGSRSMRRRLSDVYEGHHIPLQKLRKQMGNPEDPPGDLLSLMARRVFSQQGIMSRVNSEGLISILDAQSSFNTPSNQDRQDSRVENSNSDWLETRISSLPRIRTQLGVSESAHSVGMV
ncbi:hypothetical protein Ndes2437A_g03316 [Nannochloris sp. 'desiccata']